MKHITHAVLLVMLAAALLLLVQTSAIRGAVYLHIGRKRYTVNMNRKLLNDFFRASRQ